jgi:hypothetical protein
LLVEEASVPVILFETEPAAAGGVAVTPPEPTRPPAAMFADGGIFAALAGGDAVAPIADRFFAVCASILSAVDGHCKRSTSKDCVILSPRHVSAT